MNIIGYRIKMAPLTLVAIVIISLMLPVGPHYMKASASTTRITDNVIYEDETVSFDGSIIIENGGNLTLINATLLMNPLSNGAYNITIKTGGVLWVVSNSMLKSNTAYNFTIYMEPGSILHVASSNIQNLGYYTQPGLKVEGNITHTAIVEITGSNISIASIEGVSASITVNTAKITSHASWGGIIKVGGNTSIILDNTNLTVTTTGLTIIYGDGNYERDSSVEIRNSSIRGPFGKFIASSPSGGNLTVTVKDSSISCTNSNPTPSILYGNTILRITGSTITYQSGPKLFIQVQENNILEIEKSKILNSYIYIAWYKIAAVWGKVNLTETTLDYGVVTSKYNNYVLDSLYVKNVNNSEGRNLIYVRGQIGETLIDENDKPFQVIVLDSPGPVHVKGVKLNTSIQPVIVSNSTLELDNVNITVNGQDDFPYLPRVILSIYNSNITIRDSILNSTTGYYGEAIKINDGGNVTIVGSKIYSTRHSMLIAEKHTSGIPFYIRIYNTTVRMSGLVSFYDYTEDRDGIMIIDDSIWEGYSTSARALSIGVSPYGRLIIANSTFSNIEPTPLYYGAPATLILPHDYSRIEIVKSLFNLINRPLIEFSGREGVRVNVTSNNITLNLRYVGDGYIIKIGSGNDNGRVHVFDNNVTGVPLYTSSNIGMAYIDDDGVNETVNLTGNRIKDCILGIVIGSSVKTKNIIVVKNNNFTTMGGIIFVPGSQPVQTILGNKISNEDIIYVAGQANLTIEESSTSKISQLIVVNSKNITVKNLVSGRENIIIQIINSTNVNINNLTARTDSGDYLIRAVMLFNSTHVTMEDSEVNQTLHYGPFSIGGVSEGGIFIANSTLQVKDSSIRLVRSVRGVRLMYAYSSVLTLNNTSVYLEGTVTVNNPVAVDSDYSSIIVENVNAMLNKYLSTFADGYYSHIVVKRSNLTDSDSGTGIHAQHSTVAVTSTLFYGDYSLAIDLYRSVANITSVNVSKADTAIKASNSKWINILNCSLRGLVDISYSNDILFKDVAIENDVYGSYGLRIYYSTDVVIVNSSIARLGQSTYFASVYLSNSRNITLTNVKILEGGGSGIQLASGSDLMIVDSNVSLNKAYGILVSSGSLTGYYLDIGSNGNYSDTSRYDGIYLSSGYVEIHKSNITENYRLGAYALQEANLTENYWGSSSGPELLTDPGLADEVDPEEILDPSNNTLEGNSIAYQPYLSTTPIRETIEPEAWIESPENGSTVYGLTQLEVRGKDNEGVSSTIIMVDGRIEAVLYGANQTYKWDTTTVPDGDHNVTIIAVDYSGNMARKTYYFHVANVHPYTEIVRPRLNYTCVSGSFPVTVFASDNNPDRLEVYINGTRKNTWTGSNAVGTITYYVYTPNYNDGDILEVKFILTDLDGFSSTSLVYLRVDNTPPSASINNPVNNSYVPEVFDLSINVNDNIEFQMGEVHFNSTLVYQTDGEGTQTIQVNLTDYGYKTGDKIKVNLTALDCANNTATVLHYVTVDMDLPHQEITSPANNTQVSGIVNLSIVASDNYGIAKVKIYINGTVVYDKLFYDTRTVEDYYEWDTTAYDPGVYEVVVESEDVAHNVNSTKYYFEVAPEPIPEPGFVGIIVSLVVIGLIVYYQRKPIS